MEEPRSIRPRSLGLNALVALGLLFSSVAFIAVWPWFEEDVLGSHHAARFYRDIGIDIPLTWIADNFEKLH